MYTHSGIPVGLAGPRHLARKNVIRGAMNIGAMDIGSLSHACHLILPHLGVAPENRESPKNAASGGPPRRVQWYDQGGAWGGRWELQGWGRTAHHLSDRRPMGRTPWAGRAAVHQVGRRRSCLRPYRRLLLSLPSPVHPSTRFALMFPTFGAHQISSITELRQDTNHLLDHADETGQAILLQRNNDPVAVLISVDTFRDLVNRAHEGGAGRPDAV